MVYLLLAFGGVAGAVTVSFVFHMQAPATIVTLLPALAGWYLAWASFRVQHSAARVDLAAAADQLARVVREQWEAEVQVRRVNDPYALPVSWRTVDPDLAEDWSLLETIARNWPAGPASDPAGWASCADGLAASDGEIWDVFSQRVPTRRLAVLGPPGSGKTVLLVRLLLALIERRPQGGAVPVLFPLSSWNPAGEELGAWMVQHLARDYVSFGTAVPTPAGHVSLARALLDARLILPILDGLDEIPRPARGMALEKINAALPLGHGLVLSSRVAEFRELVATSGLPVRLAGAAGIELQPLSPGDTVAYLRRTAGGEGSAAALRWEPVIAALNSDTPVRQALTTPLVLFLARTTYNPRFGESFAALPEPAELCDTTRFPTRTSVETHLFEAFLPAAYRPHPRYPCRWTAGQATRVLTHLARHLEHSLNGTTDLAWWQLGHAVPQRLRQVGWAIVAALAGWAAGAVASWLTGSYAFEDPLFTTDSPSVLAGGVAGGLVGGIPGGMAGGVLAGLGDALLRMLSWHYDLYPGDYGPLPTEYAVDMLAEGITGGLLYGFGTGVVARLLARRVERRRDRPERLRQGWQGLIAGGVLTAVVGGAYWLAERPDPLTAGVTIGIVYGIAAALLGMRNVARRALHPSYRVQWSWNGRSVTLGAAAGLIVGSLASLTSSFSWGHGWDLASAEALTRVLATAIAYSLAGGFLGTLTGRPANPATAVSPMGTLAQDRTTFWRLVLTIVFTMTACLSLISWVVVQVSVRTGGQPVMGSAWYGLMGEVGLDQGLTAGLPSGVALGVALSISVGSTQTAWTDLALARLGLRLSTRAPWRLLAFLADAHERRGVLRQTGAVYQFRHTDLQRHLARHE